MENLKNNFRSFLLHSCTLHVIKGGHSLNQPEIQIEIWTFCTFGLEFGSRMLNRWIVIVNRYSQPLRLKNQNWKSKISEPSLKNSIQSKFNWIVTASIWNLKIQIEIFISIRMTGTPNPMATAKLWNELKIKSKEA